MASLYILAFTVMSTIGAAYGTVVRTGNNPTIGSSEGIPYANTSFLLDDVILQDGKLFAYSAYFLSANPIRFQIWRPEDLNSRVFQLMWETRIVPSKFKQRIDIYMKDLPGSECVWVRNGYRLGVFTEVAPSSVAHYFNPHQANALKHTLAQRDPYLDIGRVVSFDPLAFPYDYSVSVYVNTGYSPGELAMGVGSTSCPHVQIVDNPGLPTPTDENDPPASAGTTGGNLDGTNVLTGASVSGEEVDGNVLMNWHVILVILIWLAALTIINICLILALYYLCNNQSKYMEGEQRPPQHGWTDFEKDFYVERKRRLHSLSTTELEKDFYSPDDKLHLNRVEPAKM